MCTWTTALNTDRLWALLDVFSAQRSHFRVVLLQRIKFTVSRQCCFFLPIVLLFGCCGGSLWALCTLNLQSFLVLVVDLTSVVSALRLLNMYRSFALFACLLGIMLEACLLRILSDQPFIFCFSRPNKACTRILPVWLQETGMLDVMWSSRGF